MASRGITLKGLIFILSVVSSTFTVKENQPATWQDVKPFTVQSIIQLWSQDRVPSPWAANSACVSSHDARGTACSPLPLHFLPQRHSESVFKVGAKLYLAARFLMRKMPTFSPFVVRNTQCSEKSCRSLLDPVLFYQTKSGKCWAATISKSGGKLQNWPTCWFRAQQQTSSPNFS